MDDNQKKQDLGGERRAVLLCVLLSIAYVSIFFIPQLLTGSTTLGPSFQDETQWLLYQDFISQSFARGFFPLWTPDLYCGMPFLAWSHSAALYPGALIFAALDFSRAVWVNLWLHSIIYCLGLFFLCRRLGAGFFAAMFSVSAAGALIIIESQGDFLPSIRTGAYAPWLFLFAAGMVVDRRFRQFAGFVLVNLLMYLGGHIELLGLAYEVMAVAFLGAFVVFRGQWTRVLCGLVIFSAAFAVSYLIAQIQALPTLELTSLSIRGSGLTYDYFRIWSSTPVANLSNWMPYLACALIPVCLAAAVCGARENPVIGLLLITLIYCALIIHNLFGFLWVLYHLPVLRGLLGHSRIIFHARIIVAVMIALGLDRIIRSPRAPSWFLATGVLAIAMAVAWLALKDVLMQIAVSISEPTFDESQQRLIAATGVCLFGQALVGVWLIFTRPGPGSRSRLMRPAVLLLVFFAFTVPVIYGLSKNPADVFQFPPEYAAFFEQHKGLYRTQTIYDINEWDKISIPLQAGEMYGTRAADGFITVSVDRYTRFLNAIAPGTFREKNGRIADLEATRVLKDGEFINDRNIPFLDFMGMRFLVTELKNIKFASPYFLAFPDSPLAAEGVSVRRRRSREGVQDLAEVVGRARCRIYVQQGDRLVFNTESGDAGRWLSVYSSGDDGQSPRLLFSRWIAGKKYSAGAMDLSKGRDYETYLNFAAFGRGPETASLALVNPVIENDKKYFQRTMTYAGFNIFNNPGAMPAAFLLGRARSVERASALEAIEKSSFDPTVEALVEGRPSADLAGGRLSGREGVKIERYTPESVEMTAVAGATRLLVLTDVYYPGWRMWVDSREEAIRPVNLAFRGVVLDQGVHRIKMVYNPPSFHLGLWMTLTSLFWLMAAAAWRLGVRKSAGA